MSERIAVSTSQRDYEVLVGRGLLGALGELATSVCGEARVALCSDENVAALHLPAARAALSAGGLDVVEIVVPAGEAEKNLDRLRALYDAFYSHGLRRDDIVLALGGGVVGDLVGMAAATYLRGVRLVQVPTTLLAQVDASVGGKVAVDFRSGKNHVGTFYQPWLVVADLDTLATLPARELVNGLAEVLKYAFLAGNGLLDRADALVGGRVEVDESAVAACVRVKAGIVAADEREETGQRELLNLGHTIGHAIEAAAGFSGYSHGEAVGLGLRATLWLSQRLAGLSQDEAGRGQRLLSAAGLPERLDLVAVDAVEALIGRDKKAARDGVRYVLLGALGEARPGCHVPGGSQQEVLAWLASR